MLYVTLITNYSWIAAGRRAREHCGRGVTLFTTCFADEPSGDGAIEPTVCGLDEIKVLRGGVKALLAVGRALGGGVRCKLGIIL